MPHKSFLSLCKGPIWIFFFLKARYGKCKSQSFTLTLNKLNEFKKGFYVEMT